jgi:Uma2 family endonuclease
LIDWLICFHTGTDMTTVEPIQQSMTREEYFRLAEAGHFSGQRVERIHGVIVTMSPEGKNHWLAVVRIQEMLRATFGAGFFVTGSAPFSVNDSDPEPDVMVVPGAPRDYTDFPTRLSLAVEVSVSSSVRDTTLKASLYAASGIEDYWVVDVKRRRVIIFRKPIPDEISDSGDAFASRKVHAVGDDQAARSTDRAGNFRGGTFRRLNNDFTSIRDCLIILSQAGASERVGA